MSRFFLPVVLSLALASAHAHAQTTVTLYAQNFDSPATTACTAWGGAGSANTLSSDYNGAGQVGTATFDQIGTADRVCWGQGSTPVQDPAGTAGSYSGGFARNDPFTESWAIGFDPAGMPYINGQVDLAHITPGNLDGVGVPTTNYPGTAASVRMALRFFRVPSGAAFTLQGAGAGVPANVLVGATALTPLPESGTVTIPKSSSVSRYDADWSTHLFAVDTSAFAPGDQLVLVGTVVDNLTYIVFDNLTITAATSAAQPPGISKRFGAAQVMPGQATTLTIDVSGNSTAALNDLAILDMLPAPLELSSTATVNTCGGALAATPGATQLALTGGTLPADGCQIQVEVVWPAGAAASCTGAAITNTIADGSDFTVGTTPTAGVDATAQLVCNPSVTPSQPKPVPASHPVGWLLAALGLTALAGRRYAGRTR